MFRAARRQQYALAAKLKRDAARLRKIIQQSNAIVRDVSCWTYSGQSKQVVRAVELLFYLTSPKSLSCAVAGLIFVTACDGDGCDDEDDNDKTIKFVTSCEPHTYAMRRCARA